MGDFNIAQFLGGIVQGMGKGLTSDKGGSDAFAQMEVIPKKKNAPPVIEMTPSQTAATDIVKGAGEAVAMGQPILSPSAPVAPVEGGNVPAWRKGVQVVSDAEFEDTSNDPPAYDWSGERIEYGNDIPESPDRPMYRPGSIMGKIMGETDGVGPVPLGGRRFGKPRMMRQMRSGGITDPGEEVIVHENEKVQGLPNGQVIVTPEEEVAVDRGMPQPDTPVVRQPDRNPERPPNMAIPETVEEGENDVGYLERKLLKDTEVKPSPWKDLGAALIQAGNNHFNNKNEPVRTWGEIQRDKRVAPTAGKLALVRDAKKTRMDAETNAAKLGLVNQQIATSKEDDIRQRQNLERLEKKDAATVKNWERKADQKDFQLIGEAELREMRDKWKSMDDENSRRRLDIVEQEMKSRNARRDAQTENDKSRLTLDQQKAASLDSHRRNALKIAATRKASDGSKQSEDKIDLAKVALKRSLGKAVKDGFMTKAEAQDILAVDAGFGEAAGDIDK